MSGPWDAVNDLLFGAVSPREQSEAGDILFTVALRQLLDALEDDPVAIAATLRRRLGADMRIVSEALLQSDLLEGATVEVINYAAARTLLTRRQIHVIELLSREVSIASIAAHLSISRKTVNRHLDDIRSRIGAESRNAILQRAREQHMLVLVPATGPALRPRRSGADAAAPTD